jgi:hypothetical protein
MSDKICPECGLPCAGKIIDDGIGPGEFWGKPFFDSQMVYVSACCEVEIDSDRDDWEEEDVYYE